MRQGQLVLLLSLKDSKRFQTVLSAGGELHTHRGVIRHDDLIGQPLGRQADTHLGYPFLPLEPSLHDRIMNLRRATQIVYPKDIGRIVLKMNVVPGIRIIEAGSGSGALALALGTLVAPDGRVYSYDRREDMLELARANFHAMGGPPVAEFKQRDIGLGFDENDVDGVFLDVREPWEYLSVVRAALRGDGYFGAIVPTANQVSRLIDGLQASRFSCIEVEEVLLRPYKPNARRLRPVDVMPAHTGYLIFARKADLARKTDSVREADLHHREGV